MLLGLLASSLLTMPPFPELKEDAICVAVGEVKAEPGTYSVVCCARDAAGNRSQYHTVKVTIVK